MLKNLFVISDVGYKNLKSAIIAAVIKNFALMIGFGVIIYVFNIILAPLMGGVYVQSSIWKAFAVGLVGAGFVALSFSREYEKTYEASYYEAENVRVGVAEHIRKLPLSFFYKKNLSEITTNIMDDCNKIEHMFSHLIPQMIAQLITVPIVCTLLIIYDWRLGMALVLTIPLSMLMVYFGRKIAMGRSGTEHINAKLSVSEQTQEYLEGIKVLKAFGLQNSKFDNLKKALQRMKIASIKLEAAGGVLVFLSMVILNSGMGVVVFVGAMLLYQGNLDLMTFFIFIIVSSRIYAPVTVILTNMAELFYMQKSVERLRAVMQQPIMDGAEDFVLGKGKIEFKDVSFSYNKGNEVISDINLKIYPRNITALVGPSGSGKSTVAKLIARFWDVDSGSITIDGRNIKDISPENLLQYISFVFQDVVLFDDTIFNNIKIGRLDASEAEVIEAAKAARCDEIVSKMPDGYNTLIGENGAALSGGERQRISIARAILKDAPIVLLDEATAALDPENESLIQEAIARLIAEKTVVIIAHRLRTIVNADKIIVLDKGRIVEDGTHSELMVDKGLYNKLYSIQQESMGFKL